MHWIRQQGLHYIEFSGLAQVAGIRHGIFLRFSETQSGRRRSFNLGLNCGESNDRVWRHRRRIQALLGFDAMVFSRQVHGNQVNVWLPKENSGTPDLQGEHGYLTGDGLITQSAGQALFIQTADCQSVFIVDPFKRVVANIHSGWRGSISNIIGRTVDIMTKRFDCNPGDLQCGIGPSLGPCCAEFVNYKNEIPKKYWPYRLAGDRFDFWRMSLDQFISAGVRAEYVEISRICTRCNTHLFYSYRGEVRTGRFSAVIGLCDKE